MPAPDQVEDDLVPVRLLRAPLRIWELADERHHDVLREFALIAIGHDEGLDVPRRLLALTDQLSAQFGGLGETAEREREQALRDGRRSVDVTYLIPRHAREAVRALETMLEEVDDFCRSGDLLTLAPVPELAEFRGWFLEEFVRQIDGEEPRPWPGSLA